MKMICVVPVLFFIVILLQGCATSQMAITREERMPGLNNQAIFQSSESQVSENTIPAVIKKNTETTDDLLSIKVYPVPWQPNSVGKFGSAKGSCGTGLIIDGITSSVRVRIYNLQGDLTWEANTIGKCIAWNGKNLFGRDVASGVYIVNVYSATGGNARTTVAIER